MITLDFYFNFSVLMTSTVVLYGQGMGNMRTVRLHPVRLGLGEISAFMLPE